MCFAAKEAVEKKAMERGLKQGLEQGHQEERERVRRSMKERGMLDEEIAQILADKPFMPPARPYRRRFRRGGNGG